ncbi:MAG: hypothetical protein BK997_02900 [Candidatus Micrarchaeum sp. ARMAN-1]|nr:MAG: hypothetical protein BK997_02900 [Candidatus Micrarchaeum sp. ARMAN-1]
MENTRFGIKAKYWHARKQLARFYGSEMMVKELKCFREYSILSCEEHERALKDVLLLMKKDSERIADSLSSKESNGSKDESEWPSTAEYAAKIMGAAKLPVDPETLDVLLSESGKYLLRKTKKVYRFWYRHVNNEMFETAMAMASRKDKEGLESVTKSMQEYRAFMDNLKAVLKEYGPAEKSLLRR